MESLRSTPGKFGEQCTHFAREESCGSSSSLVEGFKSNKKSVGNARRLSFFFVAVDFFTSLNRLLNLVWEVGGVNFLLEFLQFIFWVFIVFPKLIFDGLQLSPEGKRQRSEK